MRIFIAILFLFVCELGSAQTKCCPCLRQYIEGDQEIEYCYNLPESCYDLAPFGESEILKTFVVFGAIDYTIDGDMLCITEMTNPISKMHIQIMGDGYNENIILTIRLTDNCEIPCDLEVQIICNDI